MPALSSEILDNQFGRVTFEVLRQDGRDRVIRNRAADGRVLELSRVTFSPAGAKKFPGVHAKIQAGASMGAAFKQAGIEFRRQTLGSYAVVPPEIFQKQFGNTKPATVNFLSVLVGPDRVRYADIVETFNPAVLWPESPSGQPTPAETSKLEAFGRLLKNIGRPSSKLLLIDNYDSFTYNLYQQIAGLGPEVRVVKNDAITISEIGTWQPDYIVVSPGPGRPADSGISRQAIERFYKSVPILGVCLGMQCIGEVFGSRTVQAPRIMHGKTDDVRHDGQGLFHGLPDPFTAARYHSLVVDELPDGFRRNAWSEDGSLMAFEHRQYPLFGVQFHPESFLTEHGELLIRNFLACHD